MVNIKACNISAAWAEAFISVARAAPHEVSTLVVEVEFQTPGKLAERQDIKAIVESELKIRQKCSTHTNANTIFPSSIWERSANRDEFYERYRLTLPRIQRRNRANAHGTYFGRLIGEEQADNQIEHIISTYTGGNHRRSALVATIFDPARDHTDQRQRGFPCLHEVMFAPIGEDGLRITGVYATQYLFDRAYGNYLGLARLGQFVACCLGKELATVTCIANTAVLGSIGVTDAYALSDKFDAIL